MPRFIPQNIEPEDYQPEEDKVVHALGFMLSVMDEDIELDEGEQIARKATISFTAHGVTFEFKFKEVADAS